MDFPEDFNNKIQVYMQNPKFVKILEKLGIEKNIDNIKEYIENELKGKFRGNISINKFLNGIEEYLENDKLRHDENGFVDIRLMLPIKEIKTMQGLRSFGKYLGQDENIYFVKEAEGSKYGVAGRNYRKEGKFNPTLAYAFFEYCGEKASETLPAVEKPPYYYVISKNFLDKNQKSIPIENCSNNFQYDENNNISHSQVISILEEYVKKELSENLSNEEIEKQCNKIELQYAVQETLKKIICSLDENLGNTSLLLEQQENGDTKINISPAYDMDLSFNLGKEILEGDYSNQNFYRTTKSGSNRIEDIIKEFSETIPGYKEKITEIIAKFKNNYIDQIFEIAYKSSEVTYFNNDSLKQEYGAFLMPRIAQIKDIIKNLDEREERQLS